ncbi:MAG: AgmX/PglI C-terminal domain-containing protein [Sandaracinaceae bacterium]|nr:AgmX/PglI C-terminal domain-containing protein [Sandaracinaceae bacterium]
MSSRGVLSTDGGAFILLDQGSELVGELNHLRLVRGRLWIDASGAEPTVVETALGHVRGEGASWAVAVTASGVDVYCAAGELSFQSPRGAGRIAQGETAHFAASQPVHVAGEDLWEDWTGGLATPSPTFAPVAPPIGVLSGRKLDANGVARSPLAIRNHEVDVRIAGDFVTTRVSQTFFNADSDALEGEYRLRLPENAIVEGFSVDTGSGAASGTVVPRQAQAGDQPVWLDAASTSNALVYDGPSRVRARVYPVAPGAVVTIEIRYTEWIAHRGELRTFVYPMHDADGSGAPLIGELDLSVTVEGAVRAVRAGMGATVDKSRIRLRRSDFRPRADFVLELFDVTDEHSDHARAYVVDADDSQGADHDRFVLLDVPTSALIDEESSAAARGPLEIVLVADVSGATESEDFDLTRTMVDGILRQLQPTDRVMLRVSDVSLHELDGIGTGFVLATNANREKIADAFSHIELGGATDLAATLHDAAALVAARPRGCVVYVGDGQPTTGPVDATAIQATLATLPASPRFFGVGVGDGANMEMLRALFGEGTLQVRERAEAARAVMSFLASAAQPVLRGLSVVTGPSIERSFPRLFAAVPIGEHVRLVGRLRDDLPAQITVLGTRDGVAFAKQVSVRSHTMIDRGDLMRRWASARLVQLLSDRAGREALIDLGVRYSVITPWTSYVIGGSKSTPYGFVTTFDMPPDEVSCGGLRRGCAEAYAIASDLGERERASWMHERSPDALSGRGLLEHSWVSRVPSGETSESSSAASRGDGGLGLVSVMRTLDAHESGPGSCVERKRTVRPDLGGSVSVRVDVDATGLVQRAAVVASSLGDRDVDACIVGEVRGTHFPATGLTGIVSVTHTYVFGVRTDDMRARHSCSDASRQPLEVRDALWRERLAVNAGVEGAASVWSEAMSHCELGAWRDRRVLLDRMMRHVGGVAEQLRLYASLRADGSVRAYVREAILRHVSSPEEVLLVRTSLGMEPPLEWKVFARMWRSTAVASERLLLIRRWLAVAPDDIDLRLRLLSLLEETHATPEAKRVARGLVQDPLADVRVRTEVGEFYLRQHDEEAARRVFSQSVELAPSDPWGREHLGNVYRAHGFTRDAYREYTMLARLRANDTSVLLLLARAANDAGRVDEALRLLQRLSETVDADAQTGAAEIARAFAVVATAQLRSGVHGPVPAERVHEREREAGVLRNPPDVFVALVWKHPDDRPELWMRDSSAASDVDFERASISGADFGIEAIRIQEGDDGIYSFSVRRVERDALRDIDADLWIVTHPTRANVRVERRTVHLTRAELTQTVRFTLADGMQTN